MESKHVAFTYVGGLFCVAIMFIGIAMFDTSTPMSTCEEICNGQVKQFSIDENDNPVCICRD